MQRHILLPLMALVLVASPVQAADESVDKGIWLNDPISGSAVWNPSPTPDAKEAVSWSGGSDAEGKADGKGVLVWISDGKIAGRFEGTLSGGKAQGVGLAFFAIGKDEGFAHYDGAFKDGQMHGRGILELPDKSRAVGDFKNDQLDGFVDFHEPDGDRYSGLIKANLPHGKGHQVVAGQDEYFGDFREGIREGKGTLLLPNGDIYVGEFKNDRPEGKGKLTNAEG
ncbi:MAG: MORN repeat-containing protein [Verrucomicrobiales bacterium]